MMSTETLKKAAIVCFILAMGGLLLGGLVANREAPPYSPKRIFWRGRMYTSAMD
jgi:hypothetical protein